jgi:hypothetical protein
LSRIGQTKVKPARIDRRHAAGRRAAGRHVVAGRVEQPSAERRDHPGLAVGA